MVYLENRLEHLENVRELEEKTTDLRFDYWLNNELFSFEWWFLIGILILPWLIGLKLFDRKRIFEILFFGTATIITAASLDSIGEDLSFWGYPVELFPAGHNAFPFNFGIVPVAFMLLHQYCSTWKAFNIGLILLSIIFAYIGEPLMQYIGVYHLFKWKFTYSFFYYMINGYLIRALIQKTKQLTTVG
jgi:hypothetical protein